ncbi:MAG: tRNA 2-thiouridine(34) synthase MnmA [Lentisphaeria bacterium]|nr:tRNA 2-thiouridine(34) synthase MnmA [Lentisphaeria bacterium]
MKEKIVVALSGGVDSSVAAALAVEAGYEVVGATLRLKHPDPAFSAAQLCASKNDEAALEQVVRALGIEHRYIEGFERFRERVLEPAARDYMAGRTPNPCCDCNLLVKFGMLVGFAEEIGASRVLTGHYAKLAREPEGFVLRRGGDPKKDQSYFLYRLTQRELSKLSFPVGAMEKSAVREIAARLGLATSRKPDSQDACFQVGGECFGETLRRLCGFPAKPGRFVFRGRTVGRHAGAHRFTIGQRKGLNVALGVPAYVAAIDPESGDVLLETEPEALLSRSFPVRNAAWQLGAPPEGEGLEVQIRYRSRAVPCRVEAAREGELRVIPAEPLRAVTPGQAAVFYRGDRLLGGGVIGSCC